eukprot:GHVN01068661.1.p1 GENE.GHVN01068661.1~~GHVN01068661.1.p1  ORF type:complete len:533 (+),score=22.06 GHVN01068661.1:3137-4735(+)
MVVFRRSSWRGKSQCASYTPNIEVEERMAVALALPEHQKRNRLNHHIHFSQERLAVGSPEKLCQGSKENGSISGASVSSYEPWHRQVFPEQGAQDAITGQRSERMGERCSQRDICQRWSPSASSRSTRSTNDSTLDSLTSLYSGPDPPPPPTHRRLHDPLGPVGFNDSPLNGGSSCRGELRPWATDDKVISQNSSKRKVHKALWLSSADTSASFPAALKFVEDCNTRDGRSIKREIECHLYIHQRLSHLMQEAMYKQPEDAWPCAELFGYHLDKKSPGNSVLIARQLSGPDFFDVIRLEHSNGLRRNAEIYEWHKLQWCTLAMKRIAQYAQLGIRHNDIKPDNIMLDFYHSRDTNERLLDVKLIDLGTASMHSAKEFTGGTSWYESPEQKLLEYHTKKEKNLEAAKQVLIGLSSDMWGAGLSITEVLMGRRVVDTLRPPHGPGPLEYAGAIDGWALEPDLWVDCARHAVGLEKENRKLPICTDAARTILDSLVVADPEGRGKILDAIAVLEKFTEEARLQILRKNGPQALKN